MEANPAEEVAGVFKLNSGEVVGVDVGTPTSPVEGGIFFGVTKVGVVGGVEFSSELLIDWLLEDSGEVELGMDIIDGD